jgi:hypothetical protein
MIFVIIIWIFSTITMFNSGSAQNKGPDISPIKDQLQNLQNNAPSVPSIQDISGAANSSAQPTQYDGSQANSQQTNDN